MTLANRITLARIALIPVFVYFALRYGWSAEAGHPESWSRIAAIIVFLTAAGTDWLDGWAARHYNQKSWLGSVLDPLADKGLLLAAIITLSLTAWTENLRFPWWFPFIVILRDVLTSLAAWLINRESGRVRMTSHWTGKSATVAQMVAIGWVMLGWTWIPLFWPSLVATLLTFASGMVYLADGWGQWSRARRANIKAALQRVAGGQQKPAQDQVR